MVVSQDNDLEVYMWYLSKHPSLVTNNESNGDVGESQFVPQGVCVGHTTGQDLYGTVYTMWYSVIPSILYPYPKWNVL